MVLYSFFFNATAAADSYTLSLHDALPIFLVSPTGSVVSKMTVSPWWTPPATAADRKSTRLNSSHLGISYAVFCLKKKNFRLHEGLRLPAPTCPRELVCCWRTTRSRLQM